MNDRRFRNYGEGKLTDIAFHMHEDERRHLLGNYLAETCRERGWTMSRGILMADEYAQAFSRAWVTINVNRNPETRNHRVFDAMACYSCVLADPQPEVSGEETREGVDYAVMDADLPHQLESLLAGGWEPIAKSGYMLVNRAHTWQVRAHQLRAILAEVFGWSD